MSQPASGRSPFPISIKGVVFDSADRVLLLRNERDEWELPGGRIEIGETQKSASPAKSSKRREIVAAGLGRDISLCDLRSLRDDPAVELSSIRAQSVQMPTAVTDAFDAVLTVPTITTEVDLTLG